MHHDPDGGQGLHPGPVGPGPVGPGAGVRTRGQEPP